MLVSVALLLASAAPGGADEPVKDSLWSVSFHGVWSGRESAGSQTVSPLGGRGPALTLASGGQSRVVSSWYFGDGAALLTQVVAAFSSVSGSASAPIVPLESALSKAAAGRTSGFGGGFRLSRRIGRESQLELSVDHKRTRLDLGDNARAALDDTSNSFSAAFKALLGTAPATAVDIRSTVDHEKSGSGQTNVVLSARVPLYRSSKLGLFALGGGGVAVASADTSGSTLNGRYSFSYLGVSPMSESDSVSVRLSAPRISPLVTLGATLMVDISQRSGLRLDLRMDFVSSRIEARTRTAAVVATGASPAVMSTAFGIAPGLQFSTQPGVRSTLSGPSLELSAFSNSAWRRQPSISLGFYRRFYRGPRGCQCTRTSPARLPAEK